MREAILFAHGQKKDFMAPKKTLNPYRPDTNSYSIRLEEELKEICGELGLRFEENEKGDVFIPRPEKGAVVK